MAKSTTFLYFLLVVGLIAGLAPATCFSLPVPAVQLNRQGIEALRQGDAETAIARFRQALSFDSTDRTLRENLGQALLMRGEILFRSGGDGDEVMEMVEEAATLTEIPRVQQLRGLVRLSQRDYAAAEVALLEVTTLQPGNSLAWQALGSVYEATSRFEMALESWERALDIEPDNSSLRQNLDRLRREETLARKMTSDYSSSFVIQYEGEANEDLGQEILDILEQAYAELGSEYNLYPSFQIPVILYGNKDFSSVTEAPEWVAGLYDGKIRIPLGGVRRVEAPFRQLLYHEYSHVLIQHLGRGNVPLWLNEGLAMLAGRSQFAPPLLVLEKAVREGETLSFAELENAFRGSDPVLVRLAYEQSYVLVRHLVKNFGWYQIPDILRELAGGKEIREVLSMAYADPGLTPEVLLDDWRRTGRVHE